MALAVLDSGGPVTGGVHEWPPHIHVHPCADPRPALSEGDVQSGQQAPVFGEKQSGLIILR